MKPSTGAVFLSYASQDAEAALRICEALRAAGLGVFLDQSELRGGDAWDQKIRREIQDCALFIPVISRHTQERLEGYFRREWKLATERTLDMAEQKPFLVPVVIDDTTDRDAVVPERFRVVQWTRLPDGETPAAFVGHVQRLLSPPGAASLRASPAVPPATSVNAAISGRSRSRQGVILAVVGALLLAALAYFSVARLRDSKPPAIEAAVAAAEPAPRSAAFTPPAHSIAVLPFVNMSGDKEQEYFSDGLTEELLNALAAIDGLQVAARTSAFSFKDKDVDIGTIARKLNVGTVLEGSVRRSAHTVRITAQLIDAVSGFHLWSKTYDRDLGDVLKLQTQIATAVADSLKVTLLADTASKIELGGTHNAAAFDAYLHASRASDEGGKQNYLKAIAAYSEAIRLDPNYALALAGRSFTQSLYASQVALSEEVRGYFDRALGDARRAADLAPELAEAHLALGFYMANGELDMRQATEEFQRARALAPGAAAILRVSGIFAVMAGRAEDGLGDLHRAVTLDPLSALTHHLLGFALYLAHQYEEAKVANSEAISLDPELLRAYEYRGLVQYQLGDFDGARRTCEPRATMWQTQWCLALAYRKLGRNADAQAELAKIQQAQGDTTAYQFATIYAQWGEIPKALEWLENAMRPRDPGLSLLKQDPLLDPLRKEPRFQAIERTLKFTD